MSQPEIIVVGSGPAGVSAAEAFRRHRAETPVRVLTADPAVPYARPPLSKEFLRGDTDDIALHPEEWYTERRIDRVNARVERIDPDGRFIIAEGQRHPYSALILASGSAPTPLPVPGGDRGARAGRFAHRCRCRNAHLGVRRVRGRRRCFGIELHGGTAYRR